MRRLFVPALLLLGASCVSGNKVRADSEVIQASVDRARRSGAMRCAPVELAEAEAHLDFAQGELRQGASYRASEHIRVSETAIKRALELSKDCAPPKVVYSKDPVPEPAAQTQTPPDAPRPPPAQQQVVVQIEEKDGDGDGVPDKDDPCPDRAEDKDGFEDADGCPEPDNDGDGVLDGNDKCPLTAGPLSNQGCPQEAAVDSDGDGIPDPLDKCVQQPEDKDGFEDSDGCPDLDNDADGIPDTIDRCPVAAGPLENGGCPDADKDGDGTMDRTDLCPDQPGPQEMRGCPDPDRDHDGIPDRLDVCPDDPGVKEERGCAKKYKLVVVKRDKIEIKKQIKFASGSAKIIGKESFSILDDVAQVLADMPSIKKVRIEGHTDSLGKAVANMKLSQARADAVMAQLLKRGIDPGRMQAVGYGPEKPIASNFTAKGRADNRRTEFNIVE